MEATLLKPSGRLALVTNAHSRGGTHTDARITGPIRDLHRQLAPEVGDWDFPTASEITGRASAGVDIAKVWARVERKLSEPPAVDHLFRPPTVKTYPWLATYDTEAYLAMLASQSSYALMEPTRRDQLLEAVAAVINDQLGGTVTKEYVTVLAVASLRSSVRSGAVVVDAGDPSAGDVAALVKAHWAFSRSATPAEFSFALGADQMADPAVTFFTARAGGELLGVAALKHIDAEHVELKSMHTRRDRRRQGVGELLVRALIETAAARGYRRMSLETGTTEAFAPARSLYRKHGFTPCGPFAVYHDSAHNTFMTIAIEAGGNAHSPGEG